MAQMLYDQGPATALWALATVAATLAAAVIAVGACSSEDSSTKSTTTAKGSPATSTPVPSTVNDADFEQQAATAEAMIANAGRARRASSRVPTTSTLACRHGAQRLVVSA